MKLTLEIKAEVLEIYETWLNAYIGRNVKTYDYYFDEEYHFIGSTDNEQFLNRKETTAFLEKTGDQLTGKTQMKNRVIAVELFEGIVFVAEFLDAWFLIENE